MGGEEGGCYNEALVIEGGDDWGNVLTGHFESAVLSIEIA